VARIVTGLLAGAGLVVWSEAFRKKGFAAFSYSLKAVGSGVLYLSLWAAFHLYGLIPSAAALGLMVAVTAWNAFMAWAQSSELLAAYALAGGFATPLLLSTGGNHEVFLFTYLLAIDLATVLLVRLKAWPRLLLGAFPLTVGFFIGWYVRWWSADALAVTSVFIVLFDSTFSSVPLKLGGGLRKAEGSWRGALIEDILLPPGNAAFAVLAFYSVLQDSGYHSLLPWMVLVYAAVYLGFTRLPQSRAAQAVHLAIAVVLLTVAIPLKASGHWITVGWLAEGAALLWVTTRVTGNGEAAADAADVTPVLRRLALGALALGFAGLVFHVLDSTGAGLLSGDTATALVGVAVFGGVTWLAMRMAGESWVRTAMLSFAAAATIAVLLTAGEVLMSWSASAHAPLGTGVFWKAVAGLVLLAGTVAAGMRVRERAAYVEPMAVALVVVVIAFNVLAVMTGVREVAAIWEARGGAVDADAALKQALAISAWLMAYGAALVAVGFWRRAALLRGQGLALLAITICKAFLYDMRTLSQGYRVASFLGLGVLLMGVSFVYQKDWLALRVQPADAAAARETEAE
jgi:uncharacterized membrane protein